MQRPLWVALGELRGRSRNYPERFRVARPAEKTPLGLGCATADFDGLRKVAWGVAQTKRSAFLVFLPRSPHVSRASASGKSSPRESFRTLRRVLTCQHVLVKKTRRSSLLLNVVCRRNFDRLNDTLSVDPRLYKLSSHQHRPATGPVLFRAPLLMQEHPGVHFH